MDIEDFFDKKHRFYKKHKMPYYTDIDEYNEYHKHGSKFNWLNLLQKISNNKKLKRIIIIAVMLFLVIVIVIIAALFPVINKIFNYILENGISGLIKNGEDILNNLWNGSK